MFIHKNGSVTGSVLLKALPEPGARKRGPRSEAKATPSDEDAAKPLEPLPAATPEVAVVPAPAVAKPSSGAASVKSTDTKTATSSRKEGSA